MATKIIENITGSDIDIVDLGITVPTSGTYDLSSKPSQLIANSDDLITQLGSGNIVVQKDPLADPITYYDISEGVRAIYDFHESMPKSTDKIKLAVHQSSKPSRTDSPHAYNTHWTGSGDDTTNHILGGGDLAFLQCTNGNATTTMDAEFDSLFGKIYVLHCYLGFADAGAGDYISASAFAKATPLQQAVDLDYELDGDRVKYADGGSGTGTHGLAGTPALIPNMTCAGYWNYTEENGLEPSMDQSGCFDIWQIEYEVDRFINKIPVYGTNSITVSLEASDYAELPPGYFLRLTAHNISDTNWKAWFFMECYRERSVDADR
jgi:hypothetical protein